jgi:hypothetical protein
MLNWKGFGRKLSWSEMLSQYFPGGSEENHLKTSVRIAGVLAETQTERLPNTGAECYHYTNSLVKSMG